MVLRALREARGITQDGWAARLGSSRKTVQRWESGEAVPDARMEAQLFALCRELGLFSDDGAMYVQGLQLDAGAVSALLVQARLVASHAPGGEPVEPEIPPLPPSTLPRPLARFIDRSLERAALYELVRRERLVTITGPGGVGKTQLALAVAADLRARFNGQIVFVPLEATTDPDLIASTIATALGIREAGSRPALDLLRGALQDRACLLVLDNFEQVVAGAPLLARLLADCSELHVLVTSRAALHLTGERRIPLETFSLPEPDAAADAIANSTAVEFFVERARAAYPALELSGSALAAIGEICRRLDGLPLAIELAAARARLLSPQALLRRLDDHFTVLGSGPRDAPLRQRTLHATLEWSYELLSNAERALFRRLAVFPNGAALRTVHGVCGAAGPLDIETIECLEGLADQSLIVVETDESDEPRFQMLATVRAFAAEQLSAAGEADQTHRALLRHYLRRAGRALEARFAHRHRAFMREFEREIENIRGALSWGVASTEGSNEALQLAAVLITFWAEAHLQEGRSWIVRALEAAVDPPPFASALALLSAAQLAVFADGFTAAAPLLEESMTIARAAGLSVLLPPALGLDGLRRAFSGDSDGARRAVEEAVAICREQPDAATLSTALYSAGATFAWLSDLPAARTALEESVAIGRSLSEFQGHYVSLRELGLVALHEGDPIAARHLIEESLAVGGHNEQDPALAQTLVALARVALAEGERAEAAAHLDRALAIIMAVGAETLAPLVLSGLAALAAAQGEHQRAVHLYGAAESEQALGAGRMRGFYRDESAPVLDALRELFGAEAFDARRTAGASQPLANVLAGEVARVPHV